MATGKRKIRRCIEGAFLVLFMAVPVVLVAVWLALHHKPSWYRPVTLNQTGIQQARRETVNTADFISDRMVEGQPFTVVLTEQSVNKWLAALPHVWPDARDALPPEISDPAVAFRDGRLQIGAHYAAEDWQAIVSLRLSFDVSSGGKELQVVLESAYGGSLPLPNVILRKAITRLSKQTQRSEKDINGTTDPLSRALKTIQSTNELFESVAVRNRFVWFNGERPYRIESVEIEDGELRLRIEPL